MRLLAFALALACPMTAMAAETLKVEIPSFQDGKIPPQHAFCIPDAAKHTRPGKNVSPEISWSKGPKETKSYAVVVVDPDVPQVFDDANKEGKTLAANMPRQDFHHWALINISPSVQSLKQGAGEPPARVGYAGVTDYVTFKIAEPTSENIAKHSGYDGPCPPWNDERVHRYHFKVFALNVPSLMLKEGFTGKEALAAIQPHVIAQGEAVGEYSQNPKVMEGKK